jgi:hypothetical protein
MLLRGYHLFVSAESRREFCRMPPRPPRESREEYPPKISARAASQRLVQFRVRVLLRLDHLQGSGRGSAQSRHVLTPQSWHRTVQSDNSTALRTASVEGHSCSLQGRRAEGPLLPGRSGRPNPAKETGWNESAGTLKPEREL